MLCLILPAAGLLLLRALISPLSGACVLREPFLCFALVCFIFPPITTTIYHPASLCPPSSS